MSKNNPTLFLDRDGTINVDRGYLRSPEDVILVSGAAEAIVAAKEAGFKIAIITNQAGVAKGVTPREALPLIHERIEKLICLEGKVSEFSFDDIRICIHHPDDRCGCRKPEVENLEHSVKKLGSDISRSFFIGDKSSDLLCGKKMGLTPVLVLTGHGPETLAELKEPELQDLFASTLVAEDLPKAVALILKRK